MAYSIYKTNGTLLANIADGTLDTTSTSVSLPGRNFAGYGQPQDTNFVQMVENFANDIPPRNPLKGQLWYNTGNSTLFICPADGQTNPSAWTSITSTGSNGNSIFGNIIASGNIYANNFQATNNLTGNILEVNYANVNIQANIANLVVTTATIGELYTTYISTGSAVTPGSLIGTWTATGGLGGNAFIAANGNIYTSGIKSSHYYNIDGSDFNPPGSYTNSNVSNYLTGTLVLPFTGNITPGNVTGANLVSANFFHGILDTTSNNQSNITTIGTLGNLNVTSNVYANYFIGNVQGNILGTFVAPGTDTMMLFNNLGNVGAGSNLTYTGTMLRMAATTGSTSTTSGAIVSVGGVGVGGNVYAGAFYTSGSIQTPIFTTGASSTPGTITGNWTLSSGSRMNATYADLAERFESDYEYDSGTVVELGGTKEITSVVDELSENVFGVVSSTAAYLMNAEAGNDATHPAVALSGRLHVKVLGKVKKGDRLVSAGSGKARSARIGEATAFNTIGRALSDKVGDEQGTVEAIVNVR